ncbi:NAPDH-dependent diflavin reductase [Cadophora gregata]|uniref:NAPDH-dependent diflavin reductase n=1 Tax=Cadophora gregata TaxID=51156 RepID=UPI0026DD246E|nr:NAPDH-dependent diflavin reductase [Cadophora gregata]KAK0111707.1 NAPDH-dependent diflavin reductase [Cadophora gregata]
MSETINGQPHDRYALILYGSETGNSHDVAQRLGQITERLHFKTIVTEMDDFAEVVEKRMKSGEVKKIPTLKADVLRKASLLVLVTSTTGQGEFPKNSRRLWTSLLKKNLSPICLEGLRFTTFGLGDSSYAKFNRAARLLHVRLQGLGAKELFPRGEADDQHQDGFDGAYLPWAAEFQSHIQIAYPLPEGVDPIPPDVLLPFKWTHQIAGPETSNPEVNDQSPLAKSLTQRPPPPEADGDMKHHPPEDRTPDVPIAQLKEPFPPRDLTADPILENLRLPPIPNSCIAFVQSNKRLTPKSHWQDVREITFFVPGTIHYNPGDTMTIFPQNFPEDVQALIDLMDWNDVADVPLKFRVEGCAAFFDKFLVPPVPKDCWMIPNSTLRDLLTLNLDITAIPQRNVLDILAHYTDDPTHKERLLEFSNPAYTDEFFDYATRPRRGILEVLQDFRSVKLPFNIVTTVFPVIRGRQYSIASGGIQKVCQRDYTKVQLLVAVVNYKTVLSKVRRGLCTRFLAALPPNANLMVRFGFEYKFYEHLEDKPERPVILVAPGTGLAPCRSLIWERRELAFKDIKFGRHYLFFGGRNQDADYFYKDEWKNANLQVDVFPAFSRDDPTGKKVYVQDKIREEGDLVFRLLKVRAYVFVCGSSGSMPKAVREAFIDVIEERQGTGKREDAERIIALMEKSGMYRQETW